MSGKVFWCKRLPEGDAGGGVIVAEKIGF